jgi:hypothetical protein
MIEKNRSNVVSGVVAAAANVALKKDSSPFGRAVKDPICSAGKKDEAKKDLLKKEVKKEPLNNIKILASKNKKI